MNFIFFIFFYRTCSIWQTGLHFSFSSANASSDCCNFAAREALSAPLPLPSSSSGSEKSKVGKRSPSSIELCCCACAGDIVRVGDVWGWVGTYIIAT